VTLYQVDPAAVVFFEGPHEALTEVRQGRPAKAGTQSRGSCSSKAREA
jgi:hypothetical protein